ncbi:MAG: hypothetical protein HKL91_02355 [Candidatus Eremiobacteraeota bacterium]|nr:hypothetical protein [Candidatus Eremiobacteraeota bacterium]
MLGVVQLGSDALFARAAVPASLPRAVPRAWGTAIYRTIDRIAPAPFVARELGREELRRGDTAMARAYAVTLPAGGARDALFASIERARRDEGAAIEYELAGLDLPRLRARIDAMATHPRAAYALAVRLRDRLATTTTHPDALANTDWRCGMLATNAVYHGHRPARWNPRAHRAFLAAARMAPYDNTYALALAAYYYRTSDNARARRWYRRVVTLNPASPDGWSGLGSIALREGDLTAAHRYLATALRYGPTAGSARTLARRLAARERP